MKKKSFYLALCLSMYVAALAVVSICIDKAMMSKEIPSYLLFMGVTFVMIGYVSIIQYDRISNQ